MKSPNALLSAVVLAASALAGCGQTGPLYMPRPPAKPPAMTPVPAVPVQAPATTPAAAAPAAGSAAGSVPAPAQ